MRASRLPFTGSRRPAEQPHPALPDRSAVGRRFPWPYYAAIVVRSDEPCSGRPIARRPHEAAAPPGSFPRSRPIRAVIRTVRTRTRLCVSALDTHGSHSHMFTCCYARYPQSKSGVRASRTSRTAGYTYRAHARPNLRPPRFVAHSQPTHAMLACVTAALCDRQAIGRPLHGVLLGNAHSGQHSQPHCRPPIEFRTRRQRPAGFECSSRRSSAGFGCSCRQSSLTRVCSFA